MCVSSASASPNLENDNTSGGSSSSNSANNETKRDTEEDSSIKTLQQLSNTALATVSNECCKNSCPGFFLLQTTRRDTVKHVKNFLGWA